MKESVPTFFNYLYLEITGMEEGSLPCIAASAVAQSSSLKSMPRRNMTRAFSRSEPVRLITPESSRPSCQMMYASPNVAVFHLNHSSFVISGLSATFSFGFCVESIAEMVVPIYQGVSCSRLNIKISNIQLEVAQVEAIPLTLD